MANIFNSADQYRFTGKGPLDAKALVATFDLLTNVDTWTTPVVNPNTGVTTNVRIDYNGMMVAVWKDPDATKNGVYFLHDSTVTTALGKPKVTEPANWHKMGGLGGLPGLEAQIAELAATLEANNESVESLVATTNSLQAGLGAAQADIATLKSDVHNLQNTVPNIQLINGGDANDQV